MSTNYRGLIQCCTEALDAFDPDTMAVDHHIQTYIANLADLSDKTFITEVFSGCVRYSDILRVVMNGFFNRNGKKVLRSQSNFYNVYAYLALFRLEELGMAHFRKFVQGQDVNKMHRFLTFLFNEKNLVTWMKDEWTKSYDPVFVQCTLLSPIIQCLPEAAELIQHLEDRINNKVKPKKPTIATTESKPFNLTQPKPRGVPVPEPIPTLKPHNPVPETLYLPPKEQEVLTKQREINRRKAEDRLMSASKDQFACANPGKSDKTMERIQRIMQEEEDKLDFNRPKANDVPLNFGTGVPIKLNTAAILREGRLYQKKEEDEIRKLERLEAGARDPSNFLKWQSGMRQKDLDEQLAEIERRRLEGKLSHEEAILARQNLIKENKQKVLEMKEETKQMFQEFLEQKFAEEQEMRQLVEDVMEGHQNAKEAKKKLQEYKSKIVQEVQEESKELMKQALEEAEAEMRKKMELIHEIRAMEAVPVIRMKLVDLTETAGYGLLSEMSIAELRERLSILKVNTETMEEEKRDDILAEKEAKDQKLMDTLETISRHRTEKSKAAAKKLEDHKKNRNAKPEIKDPKLIELQRKLDEKKAERLREQELAKIKISKKSADRTAQLIDDKKSREEGRWHELERNKERSAKLQSKGIVANKSSSRVALLT
ncbi:cilia- and flagella-associated protein 99-like [Lineus longissimus]|uniref:cilia- and flagella-associated protein 99-like n=1 Tax=Lineus longissimus TaxID=88925 RepID=UPI002B4DBA63